MSAANRRLLLVAVIAATACASPPKRPFPLPGWLTPDATPSSPLVLGQSLRREGDSLEVCRILKSVSDRPVLVAPLSRSGDSYDQLYTFFLNKTGDPLPGPTGHGALVPPPLASGPQDLTAIPPGGAFTNCRTLSLDGVEGEVFVVSAYTPATVSDDVAARTASNAVIVAPPRARTLLSQICRLPRKPVPAGCIAPE